MFLVTSDLSVCMVQEIAIPIPTRLRGVGRVFGVPVIMVSSGSEGSGFSAGLLPGPDPVIDRLVIMFVAVELLGTLAPLYDGETLDGRTGTKELMFLFCGLECHLDGAR